MNESQPAIHYAVDLVFCVDTTYSMTPYLDSVKATALEFHSRLKQTMREFHKAIDQLRVRIVEFRDLRHDGPNAIQGTPFFVLPDQAEEHGRAISRLTARDEPGPVPESALEALAVAIRSDWERSRDKRRHIIVVCTDAPAYPLGMHELPNPDGSSAPWPTSWEELQTMWGDEIDEGEMEYAAKRLVVFAPNDYPWNEIMDSFENCAWLESAAGQGMVEIDVKEIIAAIAGSV